MRDWKVEFEKRVEFIRAQLAASRCTGMVFGNSGGKDSALVGILCKAACENTVGVIMPCASRRNYGLDRDDGLAVAEQFGIETRVVDLTPVREAELAALEGVTQLTDMAVANIAPRLRMVTLPLLSPTSFFVILLAIVNSFQAVDQIYVMTKGGPHNSTDVLLYYIYEYGFVYWEPGMASSASTLLFAFLLILTFLYWFGGQRMVNYER